MKQQAAKKTGEAPTNKYHWYTPRFWVGMRIGTWWRLMLRHRLRISPSRWSMALATTLLTPINSVCGLLQTLFLGRRIANTRITEPPLFIIGHWRSGTTFLHELLVLDPSNTFPDTYDCFAPNHFLVTGRIIPRMLWFLLPSRRPMDNVAAGWDRPQEDEFGLMNMGVPSPYLTMAFSNDGPEAQNYLDMSGLSDAERQRWKDALLGFMQALTYRDPRRIVLKSPPHTGRVATLLELFPNARFIHIVRDPLVLFPSTVRLWKSLYESQSFQVPRHAGLQEHVFESCQRMYRAFEAQKALIPSGQFCEIRYEDLAQDPLGQLRSIYEQLNLGDFDSVEAHIRPFVESLSEYRRNEYSLAPEIRSEIARRWGDYAERYGYDLSVESPSLSGKG